MVNKADEITPDVVAVYNEHVAVISEHKKSQFQITGYLVALFAGILTWRHEIMGAVPECLEFIPALIVPLVLAGGGLYTIWEAQAALNRRRELIISSRKFLTWRAQQVYGEDEETSKRRKHDHIPIFCSILTVVAAAACIIILAGGH